LELLWFALEHGRNAPLTQFLVMAGQSSALPAVPLEIAQPIVFNFWAESI
jgi:hypothetical protein